MSTTVDENHLLDTVLKDCGEGLEFAIKSLQQLSLLDTSEEYPAEETVQNNLPYSHNSTSNVTPLSLEWADLFVKEMTNATSIDDARVRAFRVFKALEKEKTGTLKLKNMILKRAVVIQHERLREKQREMEDLKKNLLEYQEKVRILEVKNYALSIHFRQMENEAASGALNRTDVF